jgi:hypothetical protein
MISSNNDKVVNLIRYPIPNRKDLVSRLSEALVFSKFDMKSGFWQIQVADKDRYKTAFTTHFGHYEWNVMPFDEVLIYTKSINEHWKHLNAFLDIIKHNGIVVYAKKIKLFQTKISFLGFDISE